jgi:hypothetical protein
MAQSNKASAQGRYEMWFLWTTGAILFPVGLAKVVSSFGKTKMLSFPDPIIGLAFGKVLLAVGLLELVVALACFPRFAARASLRVVACISTAFLAYRTGLWFVGWHHPCSCMGSLTTPLHLSDQLADNIMKGVLAFMLSGSYLLLLKQRREARANRDQSQKARFSKMQAGPASTPKIP